MSYNQQKIDREDVPGKPFFVSHFLDRTVYSFRREQDAKAFAANYRGSSMESPRRVAIRPKVSVLDDIEDRRVRIHTI